MIKEYDSPISSPRSIVGVPVHPIGLQTLLRLIGQTIGKHQQATVMYANAYAVNLAQREPAFRKALHQATIVFCDGYGVWLAAQLLGTPLPERLTPPDWIMQLAKNANEHQYRLFLLGAKPGVAAAAAQTLHFHFPQLEITSQHGYFDPHGAENDAVIEKINRAAPDILLVGMGMPRQEIWIQENLHRHSVPIVIAVGALFDYLAGHLKRGPRWLTDSGGEWLSRLYSEPRRLWRRYLLGNPIFLWLVWCQWKREYFK